MSILSKETEDQIVRKLENLLDDVVAENKNNGAKRYFKKKDFCQELSIAYNTLQVWVAKGLPVIQIEGISLIDMKDAEKFLQDHKI